MSMPGGAPCLEVARSRAPARPLRWRAARRAGLWAHNQQTKIAARATAAWSFTARRSYLVATCRQSFCQLKVRSITLRSRQALRSTGCSRLRVGSFGITGRVPRAIRTAQAVAVAGGVGEAAIGRVARDRVRGRGRIATVAGADNQALHCLDMAPVHAGCRAVRLDTGHVDHQRRRRPAPAPDGSANTRSPPRRPKGEPVIERLGRAARRRSTPPPAPRLQDMHDPSDDAPVIHARNASGSVGKNRLQSLRLRPGQSRCPAHRCLRPGMSDAPEPTRGNALSGSRAEGGRPEGARGIRSRGLAAPPSARCRPRPTPPDCPSGRRASAVSPTCG